MRIFFRQYYLQSYIAIIGLLIVGILIVSSSSFFYLARQTHAQSTSFVTRSGTRLLVDGNPFRFAGANIYSLGLDDGARTYPTPFRIDDALNVATEMGLTVVRANSLGVSVGCALCIEPALGVFNNTAFQHIDYAIQAAKAHGLRLIVPLTDNYHFYHGGKHTFTDWRGISDENQFYTNPQVIADFEKYIYTIFTHVNSYTGIAYMNDPTIMAWETGNELLSPSNWTQSIAAYTKSIDPNHLVMDGNYGINANSLSSPSIDIYSDHFYPPNINTLASDTAATSAANKAFVISEYDWQTSQGTPLSTFLAAILNNGNIAGDMFWNIWAHDDAYGYFVGWGGKNLINLTYPGDTLDHRQRIQIIRAHGYAMQSRSVPADGIPGSPLVTSVTGHTLAWRGTAIGDTYTIERSITSSTGPWIVICNRCATDYNMPWIDTTQPILPHWYRVLAYNRVGVPGSYSPAYGVHTALRLVDNLHDWNQTFYHTIDLGLDASNGQSSRAYRTTIKPGGVDEIIWHVQDMYAFTATTYFQLGKPVVPFNIYTSFDCKHWNLVRPTITAGTIGTGGNASPLTYTYTYTLMGLSSTNFVRIRWGNQSSAQKWSAQLGQVIIR